MEKNKKTLKLVFKIAFNTIFYGLIAVLIAFSIATMQIKSENNIANLFGTGFLSVQSDSMEGELKDSFFEGDMIFVSMLNETTRTELEVGDIITYFDTNIKQFNTHRIIEVVMISNDQYYRTQGDNTPGDDGLLHTNQVLAVYKSSVSGLGNALDYLQTPTGFALFIILPVAFILIIEGVRLTKNIIALNKEKLEVKFASEKQHAALMMESEKERIRQQILEEMKKEQQV